MRSAKTRLMRMLKVILLVCMFSYDVIYLSMKGEYKQSSENNVDISYLLQMRISTFGCLCFHKGHLLFLEKAITIK